MNNTEELEKKELERYDYYQGTKFRDLDDVMTRLYELELKVKKLEEKLKC